MQLVGVYPFVASYSICTWRHNYNCVSFHHIAVCHLSWADTGGKGIIAVAHAQILNIFILTISPITAVVSPCMSPCSGQTQEVSDWY